MITPLLGHRVWLAGDTADMRDYVERGLCGVWRIDRDLDWAFWPAALRIILCLHLPLSMAKSLSGGRNRPALRFGAEVAFSASSFSVGSARR